MADQAENYEIRSNRESGFGRYDIMTIPHDYAKYYAIIIEFKVCSRSKKESLEIEYSSFSLKTDRRQKL